MSSFTKHPPLQPLSDGIHWQVVEDFEYHVGKEESNDVVKVPAGFITDGASIPKIFWSIIGGPWGKYGYAAILHDFCYSTQTRTRLASDKIFLEAMKVLQVNIFKRLIMYRAVRIASFIPWNKRAKQIKKEVLKTCLP